MPINLDELSPYQLLSTAEVAGTLGISAGSVRKAEKDGRLKAIKGFRVLYFSVKAVRDFVSANGSSAPVAPAAQDSAGDAGPMDMMR
ncbi:helix-turn-helix domain-containing protein [Bradyrhizobium genosp. P]|uniref:helix-turn-helix domain-containing protein n=1 Tax=Bradyrhizobium genosp. P TaxID=83641 RepID=UPI003CEF8A76